MVSINFVASNDFFPPKNVMKITKLQQCDGKENLPMLLSDVVIIAVKKNVYQINGTFTFDEKVPLDLKGYVCKYRF